MTTQKEQLILDLRRTVEESCRSIASAALDARKDIASAALDAKNVITSDATRAKTSANGNGNIKFTDYLYKQISLGMSIFSLFGLVLGGYIYLSNPQKDNDTALQLQDQRITAQRGTIDELTKTAQNDTKELKSEMVGMRAEIVSMGNKITELSTIIAERIPAKK